MDAGLMCQYIKFCADRLMVALEQPSIYGVTNPLDDLNLPPGKNLCNLGT
jgi:ribonucleotide reductase beta subunit family protein with ferritin-like domain